MRGGKALRTKLSQGGHQARVHLDQLVLMMARREAGPRERGQRLSKDSWKTTQGSQGTWSKNWHSDSLKRLNLLYLRVRRRREMKWLNDEDDDDAV